MHSNLKKESEDSCQTTWKHALQLITPLSRRRINLLTSQFAKNNFCSLFLMLLLSVNTKLVNLEEILFTLWNLIWQSICICMFEERVFEWEMKLTSNKFWSYTSFSIYTCKSMIPITNHVSRCCQVLKLMLDRHVWLYWNPADKNDWHRENSSVKTIDIIKLEDYFYELRERMMVMK